MPTYVYRCGKCGEHFEVFQSFHDEPIKRHDGGCGGKVTKVMSPVGIVLKGSGFYKNDSGSSSKNLSRKKSEKSESSSPSSSSESACASCPSNAESKSA